ncbi:MAG: outer membrane beta-barrel protein [Pseudomonadota bacterium]|nr:outer membrane beta-barrel protein [Pseudomonadota bacterium]
MKNVVAAVLVGAFSLSVAQAAWADADQELFDENVQQLDASLALRRTTTEQFDPIRGQSVLSRPRPDFDPVPIPVGSFQLFPALNLGTYYDSNIYSVQKNGPDDQVWKINPTVSFLSDWGRHAFGITALADIDYYQHHDEQNYKAGAIQAEGRYDIAEQTWVSGVASFQRVTEAKGTTDAPGNAKGVSQYNQYSMGAEAYRGVGKLKAKGTYDWSYYEYDPVELIGGGRAIQSDRDREQDRVGTEIGYDVSENLRPFVRGSYNWRTYTTSGQQSSDGYTVDVGAKMDFGGITTAEAWIGYIEQNYFNQASGEVAAPDFGADILWNVTELTSIEAKAQRSIEESTIPGSNAYLASEGSVIMSHELTRDIVVQLNVLYDALDFRPLSRHDDLYNVGGGGRYYINRHFYSDLTYNFQRRTSDAVGASYDDHTLFLRFGAQY